MDENQEERNGYIVTTEMKKVWRIQLDLLKRLLEVCQKYNLRIWAEGGTLLGAIRHKGYIPWDDDIDMMMLREDYEKLISIASEEFSGNLFLQCYETEDNYTRGHAQLRRSDTAAILTNDIWQTFNQGIFIDIFVFDFLPSSKEDRDKCFKVLEKRRSILYNKFYGSLLSHNPLTFILSQIILSKKNAYKKYYKTMEMDVVNYPSKSISLIGDVLWTSINYQKYMREIDWYKDTVYVDFEDTKIPVPSGYDAILKRQYGDYMKPAKAPNMHGTVIFDVDRPYTEVLKELRKKASLNQRLKKFFSFKPFFN